jgi:TolB protein
VLRGWLYQTGQPDLNSAQILRGKMYFGSPDTDGAKTVARQYAADILQALGATSLYGTKIYFVSDRSGHKEIWSMDDDGSNQHAVTNYKSISMTPAVSPDGKLVAFTTWARGNPQIGIQSLETGRAVPFRNPAATLVTTPEFAPDGQHLLFSATVNKDSQLCMANVDGTGIQQISHVRAIEVSPRVNGKSGSDLLFISHRAGTAQLWRMNIGGGGLEMLTDGMGEVSNPAWSPDGKALAFAWTRGYEIGGFNIFVMDVATREPLQITRNSGKNENPYWAPDGRHIVYASTRGRSSQIYTMLADGSEIRQLTTAGNNSQPVWAKGLQ